MTKFEMALGIINWIEYIVVLIIIVIAFKKLTRTEDKTDMLIEQIKELRDAYNYGQIKDAEKELSDIEIELKKRKDWKP